MARPSRRLLGLGAALVAGLVVLVLAFVLLANGAGDTAGGPAAPPGAEARAAGGVVVQQASVDLGRQPLDKSLSHSFVVKNTNDRTVQLGVPAIEVLDGC